MGVFVQAALDVSEEPTAFVPCFGGPPKLPWLTSVDKKRSCEILQRKEAASLIVSHVCLSKAREPMQLLPQTHPDPLFVAWLCEHCQPLADPALGVPATSPWRRKAELRPGQGELAVRLQPAELLRRGLGMAPGWPVGVCQPGQA